VELARFRLAHVGDELDRGLALAHREPTTPRGSSGWSDSCRFSHRVLLI
jgi:hypothetical protein